MQNCAIIKLFITKQFNVSTVQHFSECKGTKNIGGKLQEDNMGEFK
jgi:hypothetical protein